VPVAEKRDDIGGLALAFGTIIERDKNLRSEIAPPIGYKGVGDTGQIGQIDGLNRGRSKARALQFDDLMRPAHLQFPTR